MLEPRSKIYELLLQLNNGESLIVGIHSQRIPNPVTAETGDEWITGNGRFHKMVKPFVTHLTPQLLGACKTIQLKANVSAL